MVFVIALSAVANMKAEEKTKQKGYFLLKYNFTYPKGGAGD